MAGNLRRTGDRLPAPEDWTRARLAAVDFAAQSCEFCARACDAAVKRLKSEASPACAPSLVQALESCGRLVRMNVDLLRTRSPLHQLVSAACVAACVLVCKASDITREAKDDRSESDLLLKPVLKEVGDTCWIAANACRDVVSAAPPPSRAGGRRSGS